jgi:hypothetical protein
MASTYLSDTHGSTGNRRIFTHSFWLKRASITGGGGTAQYIFHDGFGYLSGDWDFIAFNDDNISISELDSNASAYAYNLKTNTVYRDLNAWYHIVIAFDTTQATSSNRIKLWVNGEQVTSFETSTYPSQNFETQVNVGSNPLRIGNSTGSQYFNGSMTHYHFIDGTAYDASTFGETDATTGIWKPITVSPSVTYGTNGFFLKFENSGSMGLDSSGNANNFTVNGTLTQTVDTPSNVFAVLNVLNPQASGYTIANGNLSVTANAGETWRTTYSTIGASSGKWYWEQKITNFTGADPHYIGIASEDQMSSSNIEQASTTRGFFYTKSGAKRTNNAQVSYGDSWTTGDIVGVAMDLDNNKLYFSKNGVWQNSGDPTSGATGTGSAFDITSGYVYLASTSTYYSSNTYQMNFGNGYFGTTAVSSATSDESGLGIFEYTVPSGYYALCTKNINTQG